MYGYIPRVQHGTQHLFNRIIKKSHQSPRAGDTEVSFWRHQTRHTTQSHYTDTQFPCSNLSVLSTKRGSGKCHFKVIGISRVASSDFDLCIDLIRVFRRTREYSMHLYDRGKHYGGIGRGKPGTIRRLMADLQTLRLSL